MDTDDAKLTVLLLVHSQTGNTACLANRIATVLDADQNLQCVIVDLVPYVRAFSLGQRFEDGDHLKHTVSIAGAVGVGTMTWCGHPPPELTRFIVESDQLGSERALADKPCFAFVTAGAYTLWTLPWLRSALEARAGTVVATWYTLSAPDSCVYFAPPSGKPYRWGTDKIETVDGFARTIKQKVKKSVIAQSEALPLPDPPSGQWLARFLWRLMKAAVGPVRIDANLCIGCGACRDACPYGAIDIEDMSGGGGGGDDDCKSRAVWHSERCWGCALCVATCPQGAISVAASRGRSMHVLAPDRTKEGGNNWSHAVLPVYAMRSMAVTFPRSTIATVVLLLLCVAALVALKTLRVF